MAEEISLSSHISTIPVGLLFPYLYMSVYQHDIVVQASKSAVVYSPRHGIEKRQKRFRGSELLHLRIAFMFVKM